MSYAKQMLDQHKDDLEKRGYSVRVDETMFGLTDMYITNRSGRMHHFVVNDHPSLLQQWGYEWVIAAVNEVLA